MKRVTKETKQKIKEILEKNPEMTYREAGKNLTLKASVIGYWAKRLIGRRYSKRRKTYTRSNPDVKEYLSIHDIYEALTVLKEAGLIRVTK